MLSIRKSWKYEWFSWDQNQDLPTCESDTCKATAVTLSTGHEVFPWQLRGSTGSQQHGKLSCLPWLVLEAKFTASSLFCWELHTHPGSGRGTDAVMHFSVGGWQSLTKKSMGAGEEMSRYCWSHLWKILSASTNKTSETFSHCVQIKIGTIKNRRC